MHLCAGDQERQRLEKLRDELVSNHSARRKELLERLLPVVCPSPCLAALWYRQVVLLKQLLYLLSRAQCLWQHPTCCFSP